MSVSILSRIERKVIRKVQNSYFVFLPTYKSLRSHLHRRTPPSLFSISSLFNGTLKYELKRRYGCVMQDQLEFAWIDSARTRQRLIEPLKSAVVVKTALGWKA